MLCSFGPLSGGALADSGAVAAVSADMIVDSAFYGLANQDNPPTTAHKDPDEHRVLTINGSAELDAGEYYTAVIRATATSVRGAGSALFVSLVRVNAAQLYTMVKGATVVMSAATAVQAVLVGGSGAAYVVDILCATNNPNKTVALKAIVPVSA